MENFEGRTKQIETHVLSQLNSEQTNQYGFGIVLRQCMVLMIRCILHGKKQKKGKSILYG